LDTVVENLRGLVEARAAAGSPSPWVQLNVVLMRANRDELGGLVRLAADVGVDRVWVQGLSHDFTDVAAAPEFVAIRRWTDSQRLSRDEVVDVSERALGLAEEYGVDLRLPGAARAPAPRAAGEPGCDWPWRSAYVNHDGTVQPCCMLMGRERGRMGNIGDRPLSAIWHDPAYEQLRAELHGDTPPAICAGCAVYRGRF
jgi:radical SAM protein with 4Fe4S-binding SPASM domain